MNTRIHYDYRDGANFKQAGVLIINGEVTADEADRLRRACMFEDDHHFFVPAAVNMKDLSPSSWDLEIDHPMHTLGFFERTSDAPDDNRTITDLLADFCGRDWLRHAAEVTRAQKS